MVKSVTSTVAVLAAHLLDATGSVAATGLPWRRLSNAPSHSPQVPPPPSPPRGPLRLEGDGDLEHQTTFFSYCEYYGDCDETAPEAAGPAPGPGPGLTAVSSPGPAPVNSQGQVPVSRGPPDTGRSVFQAADYDDGDFADLSAAAAAPAGAAAATTDGGAKIWVVQTPEELVEALGGEAKPRHIEIRRHMNLQGLSWSSTEGLSTEELDRFGLCPNCRSVWEIPPHVLSLRGNCSEPFPRATVLGQTQTWDPPLLDAAPNSCLLLLGDTTLPAGRPAFEIITASQRITPSPLWIDGLYIRSATANLNSAENGRSGATLEVERATFLTNSSFQSSTGEGVEKLGVRADRSRLYAEGCIFADWVGRAVVAARRATLTGCRVLSNTAMRKDLPAGVLEVVRAGEMRLERVSFEGNQGEHNLLERDGVLGVQFYSDVERTVGFDPAAVEATTRPLSEASPSFLSADLAAFMHIQEEVRGAEVELPPATGGSGSDDPLPTAAIVGIVVGTALLLAAGIAALWVCLRRRRAASRNASKNLSNAHTVDASAHAPTSTTLQATEAGTRNGAGSTSGMSSDAATVSTMRTAGTTRRTSSTATMETAAVFGVSTRSSATPARSPAATVSTRAEGGTRLPWEVPTQDSLAYITRTMMPDKPDDDATLDEQKDFLDRQLDTLTGSVVLETLRVLGGIRNRLHGGQAMVQIVEDTRNHIEYAMKFFFSSLAFNLERSLYLDDNQPLGQFLPQLHSICDGERALKDRNGNALPPCIVMEKGEALEFWTDGTGEHMDLFTGLQVLSHIAERLRDLHAAGYVHRDIKPGNIMWLPRKKRWTLIDFGCAARIGTHARTGFSLFYAAPEVLQAVRAGEQGIMATEALDAWSVGVLAIELFRGRPVFDSFQAKDEVVSMILGEQPAPWEDLNKSQPLLQPLGVLKRTVLALLDRDAGARANMADLQRACRQVLSHTSDGQGWS